MSCMIMGYEPLAALANAVETRLNCNYSYWGFEAPDSLYRELSDCKTSCTYFAERIYRKLYAVNVRAYNGRYASHEEPADEEAPDIDVGRYVVHHGPEYREHGYAVRPWHYQLAKLLDFWLYQTAEDATRSDPLRLAMQEFSDSLRCFIIQNSPEYVAVRWGSFPFPAPGRPERRWSRMPDFSHIKTETLLEMLDTSFADYYRRATTPCEDGNKFLASPEAKALECSTAWYEAICEELVKRGVAVYG